MLVELEKSLGRSIALAVVELPAKVSPVGFRVRDPDAVYLRVVAREFALQIHCSHDLDLVVRQRGQLLLEQRVTAGLSLISKGASHRTFQTFCETNENESAAPERLFPESDELLVGIPELDQYLMVQIRCADAEPRCENSLPRDYFATLLFVLNDPANHAAALAKNMHRIVLPRAASGDDTTAPLCCPTVA